MRRIDIMVDLETLGTNSNSTVFQISAVSFNIKTGEKYDIFNKIIDITTIKDNKITGDTLKWWLETDKKLLNKLINNKESISNIEAWSSFYNWIVSQSINIKDIYLWGNGIKFDNTMIDTQMSMIGIKYPIFYRNDRDVRTIVDLACMKLNTNIENFKKLIPIVGEKHNALDDCIYQIKLVNYCYDELMK